MTSTAADNFPLRVAILGTRGIPARYGGFETFAEQLAVRLARRGVAVTVYAEGAAGSSPSCADYRGVRVQSIPVPRWGAASVIAYDVRSVWHARRGFDLVYMLGYGAAFACWLPRAFGTPVWINMDGLEWARSKWSAPARLWLRLMEWTATWAATRLIADARAIERHIQKTYPRAAPCSFIAYGAEVRQQTPDAALLAAWGVERQRYFLVVARVEPENHVEEAVDAYQRYRDLGGTAALVVVGDVHDGSAYSRRVLSRQVPGLHWLGAVYEAYVLENLRLGALAYLHGHSVGGTNPSLLEALGCGNLVIAHRNVFNEEVLGELGWYFHTPAELAERMHEVESIGADERSRRQQAAWTCIEARYSWPGVAAAYEKLMREAVGQEPVA